MTTKRGSTKFQNKNYWISWHSDEEVLRKAKWNWFTARNYCRKHCMDLVRNTISVDSQQCHNVSLSGLIRERG